MWDGGVGVGWGWGGGVGVGGSGNDLRWGVRLTKMSKSLKLMKISIKFAKMLRYNSVIMVYCTLK